MNQLRKKRILLNNEASYLATGYAVMGMEILSRLAATGKYELAELASYGTPVDPRINGLKWRFYPNMPDPTDQESKAIHDSNPLFQFGKWKWEETCLNFLPDIAFAFTDPWMCEHLTSSVYSKYYKTALLIPCDSAPMENSWIDSYMSCDRIFSYTDWGAEQYKKQSNNHPNFGGTASPGVDLEIFQPVPNKENHKALCGLPPDSIIIGTVMRNQKRKLYPDLIESFDRLLQELPPNIREKTYLYLHTAVPDIGWDIPRFIKNSNCGNKIFLTYACLSCKFIFSSAYGGAKVNCKRCGAHAAITPNTQYGIPRQTLAQVINCFDLYVQYANKEGLGIPAIEAAACGVPIMATNYSGMVDVIKKTSGTPIEVKRFIWESESHSKQAYPDNDDLIKKIIQFINLPEHAKVKKSIAARAGAQKYFTWDYITKKWEDYFDSVELLPVEQTWASPPRIFAPQINSEPNCSNFEYVRWLILDVLREPYLLNSYMASRMVKDLENGCTQEHFGDVYQSDTSLLGAQVKFKEYRRQDALNHILQLRQQFNHWENERTKMVLSRMVRS